MAKPSTSAMNRVPPFMPIIWQDEESDPDISTMTDLQVGIFYKMRLRQWQIGSLPRNAWEIARECKIRSYDTTLKFLERYSTLIVCCECGASWNRDDCECGASKLRGRCENRKLKNLRIDVISGLELGTTKPNQTEQKPEPEPQPVALLAAGSSQSQSELGGSPAPQAQESPVQPQSGDLSAPPQEFPASAAPKKEMSPAEESAYHLFKILNQPDQHKAKATAWTKLMQEMLDDTGADLNDWKKFLTFTMVENVGEDKQPRFTANWMPATADPCQTLKDKLHQWYCWPEWQNTKRVRAKLASKKQTPNPDAEQKVLDLIASLGGQQ